MLDFTSALYLGLEHPSWSLPVWSQLSLGKPAALKQLTGVPQVERQLADLVGCERALLGPSTFHLFWDLFQWLTTVRTEIFVARGSYPIAQWGADAARGAGARVRRFLRGYLPRIEAIAGRPVLVTDGFFPGTGQPAPLREYAVWVQHCDGLLVVDDTQALGIFGSNAGPHSLFGSGGGGSLRAADLRGAKIVVVSSLAKAFGVPVAMIAGARELIDEFEAASRTRIHCSPPSAAAVGAAMRALEWNQRLGDALRSRLVCRLKYFRAGLARLGLSATGHMFPVQPLRLPHPVRAEEVYEQLLRRGVRTVLHRAANGNGAAVISFVITARHRSNEIEAALASLAEALKTAPRPIYKGGFSHGAYATNTYRSSTA